MRSVFRQPGIARLLFYAVWIFAAFSLGPWTVALLRAALRDGNFHYQVVSFALLLSLVYLSFKLWRHLEMRIIVTDDAIVFQKPFMSHAIPWREIYEVGAYRPRYMEPTPFGWTVYLKARTSGKRKWEVAPLAFHDGKELVESLFERAEHARFLKFVNDSWIPFFSRARALEWDKHEDLSFLFK